VINLEIMNASEKRKHLENISGSIITSKENYGLREDSLLIKPRKNISSLQIMILYEIVECFKKEGYEFKYSEIDEGYLFTKPAIN